MCNFDGSAAERRRSRGEVGDDGGYGAKKNKFQLFNLV